MSYFTRLRERREQVEEASLGWCPGCGRRLRITRHCGDLRCASCACDLLLVADREARTMLLDPVVPAAAELPRRPFCF